MNTAQNERIVQWITGSPNRRYLYHITDLRNLTSISYFNAMFSCNDVDPNLSAQRRASSVISHYQGQIYVANDQLEISYEMMAEGVTKYEFRKYLDKHVFYWPTESDCRRMFHSYVRRYPNDSKIILKFQAYPVILDNFDRVKFCKYNSGSNPLNIRKCGYKKGPHIFLPAKHLGISMSSILPSKPSEIREVLFEGGVTVIDQYLEIIYCQNQNQIPSTWQYFYKNINEF